MKTVTYQIVTLDPFRSGGPDVLRTTGFPRIAQILVLELQTRWRNARRRTLIQEGENLFATPPTSLPAGPILKTGQLADAILAFYFVGSPEPHIVEIHPPHTLRLACEADTEIICGWASQKHIIESNPPPSGNVHVLTA